MLNLAVQKVQMNRPTPVGIGEVGNEGGGDEEVDVDAIKGKGPRC